MSLVTVPHSRQYMKDGVLWWRDTKTNVVQRPMVDPTLPLIYIRENFGHTSRVNLYGSRLPPVAITSNPAYAMANINNESNEWYTRAYNKAYADLFNDKRLTKAAELGTSLAEGRESLVTIVERAKRLKSAYVALKRGQFRAFLHFLGTRPKKRHANTKWTRPKDAASLWLEYWMGWAPMLSDIYQSMEVVVGPVNPVPIALSGKGSSVYVGSQRTEKKYIPIYGIRSDVSWKSKMMVRLGCEVVVTNPNAYLLNQLGLSNPALIAWNVIPFSWMAGWFLNISQILGSYTDFVGMTVTKQYRTRYVKFTGVYSYEEGLQPSATQSQKKGQVYTCEGWLMRRTPGAFPGPSFQANLPRGLSVTRGATAISLLVSLFTKG